MASVTEDLERLAALFREGLITREQFEAQRDRLLAEAEATASARTSSPGVPNQVGAYRITGHIGDGGMGTVYRGQHRSSEFASKQGGEVAVKVMHPHVARNEDFAERFEREAGLGLKLDHPGICKVHELIVDGGVLALVMELVDGEPLSDIIGSKTGPIPWERAWPMFEQLLESVAYMHGQGVLHRDIKPENVLVTGDGRLKLLDLGIAKDTGSGQTKTGVGMGTVDYMAPEQHTDAGKVDERADVYSLGMTLYEMLAGRLPWGGELDALMVLQCKLSGLVPPPTDFYPDIAPEVVEALMGALATQRQDRTASAAELGTALEGASSQAQKRQTRTEARKPQQQSEGQPGVADLEAQGVVRPGTVPSVLAPGPDKEWGVTQENAPELGARTRPAGRPLLLAGAVLTLWGGIGTLMPLFGLGHMLLEFTLLVNTLVGLGMAFLGAVMLRAGLIRSRASSPTHEVPRSRGGRARPSALKMIFFGLLLGAVITTWVLGSMVGSMEPPPATALDALERDLLQGMAGDEATVAGLYREACDDGYRAACRWLEERGGQRPTLAAAGKFFEPYCEDDDPLACLVVGWSLTQKELGGQPSKEGPDPERGALLIDGACQKDYLPACVELGRLHGFGVGFALDRATAVELYGRACDGGNMMGCVWLGLMYGPVAGTAADYPKSVQLHGLACDGGNMMGCSELGRMYKAGYGVSKDESKAAELRRKACDGGHMRGCARLGGMYKHGDGVTEDQSKAAELFRKACDGGSMSECHNLGWMYKKGEGVTADQSKAAELFRKACDGGYSWSCQQL